MPKKKLPVDVLEYFVRMGRKGGLVGGPIRAEKLTPDERSASARKAVTARWAKRHKVPKGEPPSEQTNE